MRFEVAWRGATFAALASAFVPILARAATLSTEVDIGDRIEWKAPATERSVTFDGCQLVVLAAQGRFTGDELTTPDTRVYAGRVDENGSSQDRFGVAVDLRSALAVSNGSESVTVEGGTFTFGNVRTPSAFARLGSDLSLLDRRNLDTAADAIPTLACNDGNCLLLGTTGAGKLLARLVDFGGTTVTDGLLSVTNAGWFSGPMITSLPGGFTVAYTDQVEDGVQGVFIAQIPADARSLVKPSVVNRVPGKPLKALALAQGRGGRLLLVQERPDPMLSVPAKLLAVVSGASAPIELGSDAHDYEVDAFDTDDHFVVAFRRPASTVSPAGPTTIARVSAAGVLETVQAERAFGPAVSTPKGRFVVDDVLDLHRIAADGTETGAPVPTMSAHYPEWQPLLVSGSSKFLLTYRDRDDTSEYWHAVRLSDTGETLADAAPPVLTTPLDPVTHRAVSRHPLQSAFDGHAFVLGWLDPAGNLLLVHEDPASGARDEPVNLGPVGIDFSFHSGPLGFLVTWSEGRGCGEDCFESRLLGLIVDVSGRPTVSVPFVLVDWGSSVGEVGTADFDGNRWVVPRATSSSIEFSAVTRDGTVSQAQAWAQDLFTSAPFLSLGHPRIAWGSARHFVVFQEHTSDSTSKMLDQVVALRLDQNLIPLDAAPVPLSPSGAAGFSPEVTFDGVRFVTSSFVAWPDEPGGGLAVEYVAPDGTFGDADCFIASSEAFGASTLAPVPAVTGGAVIGYARLDPDPSLVSYRVKVRAIAESTDDSLPHCRSSLATPAPIPRFSPQAKCDDAKGSPAVTRTNAGCGCRTSAPATPLGAFAALSTFSALLLRRRRQVTG